MISNAVATSQTDRDGATLGMDAGVEFRLTSIVAPTMITIPKTICVLMTSPRNILATTIAAIGLRNVTVSVRVGLLLFLFQSIIARHHCLQGLGKIFIPLRSLLIAVLLQKSRAAIDGSAHYHLKVRADRI